MKLLIVSAYFEAHRGGVERVAGFLARGLARHGYSVRWLAADASPAPEPGSGVEPIPVSANNTVQRRLGVPIPIWGFSAIGRMRRAVADADVVMLHDTLYIGNIATYVCARWAKVPIVIVQHVGQIAFSNPILRLMMRLGDRFAGRRMMRSADQVVFISDRIAKEYADVRFRTPPKLVFNGVDTEVFRMPEDGFDRAGLRSQLDIPVDAQVILFAVRFVEKKGLSILQQLARRHPEFIFVLAGWGPEDPSTWGLKNVRVTSAKTPLQMLDLYRTADAFLLPSVGEGFPLVMQEALACGLPVMCSTETLGADQILPETVYHSVVDLTDVPGTASAWSSIVSEVMARTALETDDDRKNRSEFAHKRYGWETALAEYDKILRAIQNG